MAHVKGIDHGPQTTVWASGVAWNITPVRYGPAHAGVQLGNGRDNPDDGGWYMGTSEARRLAKRLMAAADAATQMGAELAEGTDAQS